MSTAPAPAPVPAPAPIPGPLVAPPPPPTNQLSAFGTAQATTDAQRQALLAEVARAGSAGAQQYATAQAQQAALGDRTRQTALEIAQGSPLTVIKGAYDVVTDPVDSDFARMAADLASGRQAFDQDTARQTAAGQQYFAKLSQAIPITESRTRSQVEKILAEERQRQQQIQMEVALANMQAQSAREEMAFRREQMNNERALTQMEIEDRRLQREGGGRDPLETALMQQELEKGRLQLDITGKELSLQRKLEAMDPIITRYANNDVDSPRAKAIQTVIDSGDKFTSMQDALLSVMYQRDDLKLGEDDHKAVLNAVNAYRKSLGLAGRLQMPGNVRKDSRSSRSRRSSSRPRHNAYSG